MRNNFYRSDSIFNYLASASYWCDFTNRWKIERLVLVLFSSGFWCCRSLHTFHYCWILWIHLVSYITFGFLRWEVGANAYCWGITLNLSSCSCVIVFSLCVISIRCFWCSLWRLHIALGQGLCASWSSKWWVRELSPPRHLALWRSSVVCIGVDWAKLRKFNFATTIGKAWRFLALAFNWAPIWVLSSIAWFPYKFCLHSRLTWYSFTHACLSLSSFNPIPSEFCMMRCQKSRCSPCWRAIWVTFQCSRTFWPLWSICSVILPIAALVTAPNLPLTFTPN
jgi:hypothetical protein